MNIEESVEYLKNCLNDEYNFKNATRKKDKEAIETLLTAYEKEKEKTEYEKELRIKYQRRYDSVKEKNKELEKQLQLTYQKQYINDLEAINHSNVSFN